MFWEFLETFLSAFVGAILSIIWAIVTYNWITITIGILSILLATGFFVFLIVISRARHRALFHIQ